MWTNYLKVTTYQSTLSALTLIKRCASFRKTAQSYVQLSLDLFKPELGCLKGGELEIAFKPDSPPTFCKARTVPCATLEDLNQTYNAGIKKGIWEPTQFNQCGTPVVPIRKSLLPGQRKVKRRLCGDYSVTVNPQLKTHWQPIPLPEDLMRELSSGYCFTKIDLADAYHQVQLAPDSQRRLAPSTHRGVLLQKWLPFGISSAPGYFQGIMEQLTSDLKGVAAYLDDILVSGSNADEHTLSQRGIAKGWKVNAVLQMPPPTDTSSLQSLLGSVRFYCKFIPNLSTLKASLNHLLNKNGHLWFSRRSACWTCARISPMARRY